MSNFMIELGALLVVFLISMTLALAVHEDETKLRTTMQVIISCASHFSSFSYYLDCFFLYLSNFYHLDDLVYIRYN